MRTTTNRMSSLRMLVLVCATGTIGACAQVDAEVPSAEVTQKNLSFYGIPGSSQLGEVSITHSFPLTSDKLSWAKNLNTEVYVESVEMRAAGNLQDLSFIHFARVTMSDSSGKQEIPAVEIVNYQRPDGATPSAVLSAPTVQPIDVTEVWAAGKVIMTLQIAGTLPDQDWSADITLHLSGKMSYKL